MDATDQAARKMMDNVVHAEVPAYRKSEISVNSFPVELEKAQNKISPMKPQVEGSFYSDIAGALMKTGGKLDVALGGDGYFVVVGPWGEGYTRDGRFKLDKDGRLLTVAGNFPVMGESGPIVVTPGADVEFSQNGEVKIGGVVSDSLQVMVPEHKEALESINGVIFKRKNSSDTILNVDNPRVIQGYVESSNVKVIEEMMNMMLLEKSNTTITEFIRTHDGNLSRAIEMGRVN